MKSKKVLIVDDNNLNRKLFENLIGQFWEFESAKNGLEAVAWTERTDFDLILMDIQMPQMDGISALRKIRKSANHSCPVLAITAYADESDKDNFLEMGFDGFMTKPIRPKEFLEVIRAALTSKNDIPVEAPSLDNIVLDKKTVRQLMKYNSSETIRKVYADFAEECMDLLEKIQEGLKKNDPQYIFDQLHIIKGNSGTLGANTIFLLTNKAEEEIRSGNWDGLIHSISSLKSECLVFKNYIAKETIFES